MLFYFVLFNSKNNDLSISWYNKYSLDRTAMMIIKRKVTAYKIMCLWHNSFSLCPQVKINCIFSNDLFITKKILKKKIKEDSSLRFYWFNYVCFVQRYVKNFMMKYC